MVASKAVTPEQYLAELPGDRREVVSKVREMIRKHLPKGYRETMNWGMLSYEIPLEKYPDTYNKQPLAYVALAAQKNCYSLYMMNVYAEGDGTKMMKDVFAKAGKKLDMGKSCIRFKKLDDLPLPELGKIIASTTPEQYIERYEAAQKKQQKKK